MSRPHMHIFVATRADDVPHGCATYASVDGSVPGAAVTWDHHRTGERINLDAMPPRIALDGFDGIGTTLADTDAAASVVVALLGGETAVAPAVVGVLRAASSWCDHLGPDPAQDAATNERGRALHNHVSRELARGPDVSTAFGAICSDLADRIMAGGDLPSAPEPDLPDVSPFLVEHGRVAVVDLRGRPGVPPLAVYQRTRCPVAVFVGDHPRGGPRYTVGCNPLVADAPGDLGPALRALARAEFERGPPVLGPEPVPESENWGGRATVFGSPWNHGSRLSVEEVVRHVGSSTPGAVRLILNAFSLNMLGDHRETTVRFTTLTLEEARRFSRNAESKVGHDDTARLFSDLLGRDVPVARESVALAPGDAVLVGQYRGPRLPLGTHTLPEGADVMWIHAKVESAR